MKIFFDVDGVVINGWHDDPARRRPWDARLSADLDVDRDAFQRLFFTACPGRPMSRMAECAAGRRDLRDALAEVLPELGYRGDIDAFMRYWFAADADLNAPLLATIAALRAAPSVRLFLATGQEHHRARHLWTTLGLREHFEAMFYSADIGMPKKDPMFYRTIMERLAIAPDERPILFDDQPELVALANGLGWDATVFRSVDDVRRHLRLRPLLPATG
jgi:putative hydrolase of the HAD superfamily